jgi:hypothetical protein
MLWKMIGAIEKTIVGLVLILATVGFYSAIIKPQDILYIGIAANVYLILKSRKFKPLAFLFVFWLSFMVVPLPYYQDGIDISGGRNEFDIPKLYDQTVFNQTFLVLIIALFFPRIHERIYLKYRMELPKNKFGYWCTVAFMIFIFFFGQRGQSVFAAGGYATGGSQTTTLNEYFLVLVPVALLCAGTDKVMRRLVFAVVTLYMLKDLSFGGRNGTLQNGLMLFLIFDSPKIKYWHIILISSFPLYLLLIYGAVRANPLVLFTNSPSEILGLPFRSGRSFFESLDTQNDVFYASVRFLGLLEIGVLEEAQRLKVFFCNVLAVFLPYKFLPRYTNIAQYEIQKHNAGGGGLTSAYWYLFLGLPGLVFIGWYIAFVIRKVRYSTNTYFVLYALVFFSSYPRWLAYNPIIIFKLCIYGVLFYIILKLAKNIIRGPRKSSHELAGGT